MSDNQAIPEAAVEAAAMALYERDRALIVPWGDATLPDRYSYMDEARTALEAGAKMSQTPYDFVTPRG